MAEQSRASSLLSALYHHQAQITNEFAMNIIGSLTEEMNIINEGFVEQFCLHKYRIPQTAKVINRLVKKYN